MNKGGRIRSSRTKILHAFRPSTPGGDELPAFQAKGNYKTQRDESHSIADIGIDGASNQKGDPRSLGAEHFQRFQPSSPWGDEPPAFPPKGNYNTERNKRDFASVLDDEEDDDQKSPRAEGKADKLNLDPIPAVKSAKFEENVNKLFRLTNPPDERVIAKLTFDDSQWAYNQSVTHNPLYGYTSKPQIQLWRSPYLPHRLAGSATQIQQAAKTGLLDGTARATAQDRARSLSPPPFDPDYETEIGVKGAIGGKVSNILGRDSAEALQSVKTPRRPSQPRAPRRVPRDRRRTNSPHRDRSRIPSPPENANKFQQSAKAALLAASAEAFRVRNEPGGWGGEKGKRILTAALDAGIYGD